MTVFGFIFNRNAKKRNISVYWEQYQDAKLSEGILPYTLAKYHICLCKFEQWLRDESSYPSVFSVQRFLSYLRDCGLSQFRIRNYWVALMSFYSWAESAGHISKNPMNGVKSPKLPTKTREIYKDQEVRAILNHTSGIDYRTIIMFYWKTGMRGNELLSADPNDIDLQNRVIRISGKGSRQRIIPFDNECRVLFEKNRQYPFSKSLTQVRKRLRVSCLECDIEYRGVHCFRHTFACNYLMEGGNPLDLMYILGHSTLAMVNHYSQWVASERAIHNYHKMADRESLHNML